VKLDLTTKFKDWLHKDVDEPVVTKAERMTSALAPRNLKMGPCPACGTHKRGVIGSLFELKEKTLDPKPTTITVAVLLCYECGHVNMFEASALNLG
jgi:hypothetical protein